MLKVKNQRAIKNLAYKNYKNNQKRNRTAIFAISLTTMLFAIIFTLAMGAVKSTEYNSMRMSGGMAHGSFKYLSEEQFEAIKDHPLIKTLGKNYFVGVVKNQALIKRITEMDCMDSEIARMGFIELEKGHWPEKANELVMDTISLDLLGLPYELGQTVTLEVMIEQELRSYDFILSGYYEGDPGFQASFALVSEAFVKQELSGMGQQYYRDYVAAGSIRADVMFKNSSNIDENMKKVIMESGLTVWEEGEADTETTIRYGVNWAYISSNLENRGMMAVAVIVIGSLLIVFTGYLIIYNIFQISVIRDIRFYGLLKTIGTTGKQMRGILTRQALRMCLYGIPAGVIAGFFLGRLLLPLIMVNMFGGKTFISANPVIFAGSALFSLLTVFISLNKPAKTVARISPVEAVKYSGVDNSYKKKNKKSSDGAKIYKMAFANLGRNKKRTVISIFSMTLSLVLMNMVFTISSSFDMNNYVAKFIDVDFQAAHASYFNLDYSKDGSTQLSDSLVEALESQEGFLEGGGIYTFLYSEEDLGFEAEYLGSIVNKWTGIEEVYNETNGIRTVFYGMDDFCLENLDIVKGELDLSKLKSGEGILLGLMDDDYGNILFEDALYEIGEKVKIKELTESVFLDYLYDENGNPNGIITSDTYGWEKEYEVVGYYRMSYTNTTRNFGDYATFALPTEVMKTWNQPLSRMTYVCNGSGKEGIAQMEDFLAAYTDKTEPLMAYQSRISYEKSFGQVKTMFLAVGGTMCGIIGIIGILNFINSISTSIFARKKEFAMLKSIGMTEKQLQRMLILEGCYYGIFTICLSLAASLLLSFLVLSHLGELLWLLKFKPTFLPLFVTYPFLLALGVLVPQIFYRDTQGTSIVEELREAE